jgi:hypothetical protein
VIVIVRVLFFRSSNFRFRCARFVVAVRIPFAVQSFRDAVNLITNSPEKKTPSNQQQQQQQDARTQPHGRQRSPAQRQRSCRSRQLGARSTQPAGTGGQSAEEDAATAGAGEAATRGARPEEAATPSA